MSDPFLRWAGGKRWLIPTLIPKIIESNPKRYVEPFLGAGAIALALPTALLNGALLNDYSQPLINTWRAIQKHPKVFVTVLNKVFDEFGNTKEGYLRARDEFNGHANETGLRQAALMLYLNRTCFNGLWRTNSRGEMNTPFGDVKTQTRLTENDAIALEQQVKKSIFSCESFEVIIDKTREGDCIFSDPPYHDGYVGYVADGFSEDHQRLLATKLREARDRGVRSWSTNSDTPLIRELYQWATIESISEARSVAAKTENRKDAACLFIYA